jgi:AcrR family transcriptional regulator
MNAARRTDDETSAAALPRRRDEARALFRNSILDAAEAIFAARGFHGARIQDIAARARIAVGTVYNHFAQKDDVLAALLEDRTEALLAQFRAVDDDPPVFAERLRVRVARLLGYVERHRAFFAVASEHGLFATPAAPGSRAAPWRLRRVEKFRAAFRALVEEGMASGDLEPLGGDALARFLGGTIRVFVLSSLAEEGTDLSRHAATIVDLFLHGASRRIDPTPTPRARRRRRTRSA